MMALVDPSLPLESRAAMLLTAAQSLNDGTKPFLSFIDDAMRERGLDPAEHVEVFEKAEEIYTRLHAKGKM